MSEARKSGQKEVINVIAEINKLEKKLINPRADFFGRKMNNVLPN